MGPIWYRARCQLRAHSARAAAVAVLVATLGGLVLTLTAGVLRTVSAPERYAASLGDALDVAVEQFSGRPRTDEVAGLPAVARVETATFVFGGMVRGDVELDGGLLDGMGEADVIEGLVFAGSQEAFGARVIDGREPDRTAPGEFVATASWLTEAGATLGDQFQVLTVSQEQADAGGFDAEPEGPTVPATLIGVIDGPNELQDETPLALFPVTLLDAGEVGVASSVGLMALEPGATIDDLRAQLDALPDGDAFGLEPAEVVPAEVRTAVRTQGQGLAVVAAIVAVAVIAVMGQLLSRQVRLAPAARLAMQATGFTHRQVVADRLCSVALPVAGGAVAAGVLATAASGVFPTGFAQRVEPTPGLRFEPLAHGLGTILFAALLAAWVLVALLIGDRVHQAPHRPGRVDRLVTRLGVGPVPTGIRFALARHPRDPGSVRAPILGLVIVLTVLVGALTFGASVARFVDEPARHGSNFDFATGVGGEAVPDEVLDVLEADPDVADVTLYGTLLASVGATALDVTGMQTVRGRLEPELLSGRLAGTADEMVLGRVAARRLGVDVDDEVVVAGADGPVGFVVTGLAVIPSIEGGDGIGEGAVVTLEGLHRLDPDATLSAAAVRLRSGATGAAERIGALLGYPVGPQDPTGVVVNVERARSTPYIVAGSLATLAVLSISHQLLTSARRRRRDLAVLRALGVDRHWVGRVMHWQATVVVAVVAGLAVPLGVAAGRLAYQAYIDRIGARTDISVPIAILAALVVGLLVLANVAAVVPARRVRHDLPARVLADE